MEQRIPVLLIDPSRLSRRLVTMALDNLGLYEVITADNPDSGWGFLHAEPQIQLVIMTLLLPSATEGIALVQSIRQHYSAKKLPIMIMSSNADQETVESAIQAGINDFLFKPVFPDVLEEHLARLLKAPASVQTLMGEFLVNRGLITDDQRNTALRYQRLYSSEHFHISVLALYLGYVEEEMINRLFLEEVVEEDAFLKRAHQLGVTPARLAHLGELKKKFHLRMGDILVKLRFLPREVLESAVRGYYKG